MTDNYSWFAPRICDILGGVSARTGNDPHGASLNTLVTAAGWSQISDSHDHRYQVTRTNGHRYSYHEPSDSILQKISGEAIDCAFVMGVNANTNI